MVYRIRHSIVNKPNNPKQQSFNVTSSSSLNMLTLTKFLLYVYLDTTSYGDTTSLVLKRVNLIHKQWIVDSLQRQIDDIHIHFLIFVSIYFFYSEYCVNIFFFHFNSKTVNNVFYLITLTFIDLKLIITILILVAKVKDAFIFVWRRMSCTEYCLP